MKYIVRLNPRALNPITRKIIADRLWEVEQCEIMGSDGHLKSESVKWHGADVRIDQTPIRMLFQIPTDGAPWQHVCFGVCLRGMDDVIEIKTRPQDASGN